MKIGDLVVLKSGGPAMTVTAVVQGDGLGRASEMDKGGVMVNWFSRGVLNKGCFGVETVQPTTLESGSGI